MDAIERETAKLNKGSIAMDDLVRFIDRMSIAPEPERNRCTAIRPSSEQCTRKCKAGFAYCGTHCKSMAREALSSDVTTRDVSAVEIDGIVHYLDDSRVYKTEDVLRNAVNPTVIGTYVFDGTQYIISWS